MRTILRRHKGKVLPAFHRYLLPSQLTRTAALNHLSARLIPTLLPHLYDLTPDRFPTRRKAYDAIKQRLSAPFQNQLFLGRYMGWNSENLPSGGYRSRLWHDLTPHTPDDTPDDTLSCCEVLKAQSNGARTMAFLHNGTDLVFADKLSWRYFPNLVEALGSLGFQSNNIVPHVSWRITGVLDGSWSAERVISSTWRERSVADDACEEHDAFVDADLDAGCIDDKDTSMVFHTLMSEPFLRNDEMVSQWMKSLGWKVKLDPKTHQIEHVLLPSEPDDCSQGVEENQDAEVPSTSQPRNSSRTTHADREESPRRSGWNNPRIDKSSDQAAFSNQSAVVPTAITDANSIARSAWEESPTKFSTTEERIVQRTSREDPEPSALTDVSSTSSLTDTENDPLGSNPFLSTAGSLSDSDAWELLNTKEAPAPGQDSETPVPFKEFQMRATRDALAVNSPQVRLRIVPQRERETGKATRVDHDSNDLQQLQSRGSGLPVSLAPWLFAAGRERVSHHDARDGVGAQQSNTSPGSEQLARLASSRQEGIYRDEGGSRVKQQSQLPSEQRSQLPPEQPDPQNFPFLAWLGTSAAAFMNFPLIQHLKQQQQKRKSGSGQLENTTLRVTVADQKWTFCNEEGHSILTRPYLNKDQCQELRAWWRRHDKADGRDLGPAHIYLCYLEHHYLDLEQHQRSIVPLMEHLVQDQQRPGKLAHTTLSIKVSTTDQTYFFHDEEGRQLYKRRQPNPVEHQKLKQWWRQQQPRQEHGKSAYQKHDEQVTDGQIWLMLLKQRLLQQQEDQRIQSRQPSESSAAQEEAAVDPSSASIQQPIKQPEQPQQPEQPEQPQVVPRDLQPLVNYILQYQQKRRRPGDSKNKLPPELTCCRTSRDWIIHDGKGVILHRRLRPNVDRRKTLRLWWQRRQGQEQTQQGQRSDEIKGPSDVEIWVKKVEEDYVQMLSSSAKGEAADVSSTPSSSPPLGQSAKKEGSAAWRQDRIREGQDLTSEQLWALITKKGYTRRRETRPKWIYWDKRGNFQLARAKLTSNMVQSSGILDWKFRRLQPDEQTRLRQWAAESSSVIEGAKAESGDRIAQNPPPPPPPQQQQQQQESKGQEDRSLMSRLDKISQGQAK